VPLCVIGSNAFQHFKYIAANTLKSESAENEFSEYMQNDTQSDKNASIIAANAANAKPMQNRAIG